MLRYNVKLQCTLALRVFEQLWWIRYTSSTTSMLALYVFDYFGIYVSNYFDV